MTDFTITGPEQINAYRLVAMAHGLALEINTGMQVSRIPGRSAMQACAAECGTPRRTKAGVLADYVGWLSYVLPSFTPSASIVKALGTHKPSAQMRAHVNALFIRDVERRQAEA